MKNADISKKIMLFLKLSRVKFLLYSPILYTIGVALAATDNDKIKLHIYLMGLGFVWITHIMTHLFNEYYDLEADKCNVEPSPWTGGSRVLVENAIEPTTCLRLGYCSMAISLLIALTCFTHQALYISLMTVFVCYSYSAPPLKLETRGLGELTVVAVLNVLVPLLGLTLQGGSLGESRFSLLLIPLVMVGFVRMMVMNIADRTGDKEAGKLTLVVRIGAAWAVFAYAAGQIACYAFVIIFGLVGYISLAQLAWIAVSIPLGFWVAYRLWRGDWKVSKSMRNIPLLASTHNAFLASGVLIGLVVSHASWSLNDLRLFPIYLFFSFFIYMQIATYMKNHSKTMHQVQQE